MPKKEPATAKQKAEQRPVVFPEITMNGGTVIQRDKLRVTAATMKLMLGWEAESEYKERTKSKIGLTDFMLLDEAGEKVQCWNNVRNRPFNEADAKKYAQEILKRRWRLNLETIIFSKTGICLSGQHRGVGLILATQMWQRNPEKYPQWTGEPFIESLIAAGCDEDDEVLQTFDNTRPRDVSDALYTSGLFASNISPKDKLVLSAMGKAAVKKLWQRTGMDAVPKEQRTYETVAEDMDFLKTRHPKLLQCLKHVFEENKDRGIGTLHVSAGDIAACLYLAGSCSSGLQAYLDAGRNESALDWANWDKAEEFVTLLAQSTPEEADLNAVRQVFGELVDIGNGTGRPVEKLVCLAKAWALHLAGEPIDKEAIKPEYLPPNDAGIVQLAEYPGFGGIDAGAKPEPDERNDAPVEPEEVRERIAKEQAERVAAARAKSKQPLERSANANAATVPIDNGKPDAEVAIDIMALLDRVGNTTLTIITEEVESITSSEQARRVLTDLLRQKRVRQAPGDRWEKIAKAAPKNGKPKAAAPAKKK